MNRHQFEQAAKSFRAGRITINKFADMMFPATVPEQAPSTALAGGEFCAATVVQGLVDRPAESHKADYGRVLLIGGSHGMPGAISLSGKSALRGGSGLVVVATPQQAADTVAAFTPCYMVESFSVDQPGEQICERLKERLEWADVIAAGPGLSVEPRLEELIRHLYCDCVKPVVFDADGLNLLAGFEDFDFAQHAGPRLLTPHPGEFGRLSRASYGSRDQMEQAAIDFAGLSSAVIVLKGNRTLATDGKNSWRNSTGNPGLATAGSGDVLTGLITALIGQKLSLMDAARLGVHLHGLAGDIAAREKGQVSLIATDIIEALPMAIKACAGA